MRRLIAVMLLLGGPALAQQPITGVPPLHLEVTVEQAALIVATLEAISCQSVKQLELCQEALELRRLLREQIVAQGK